MTKRQIEEALNDGKTKEAWDLIAEYEKRCPKDPEILVYKSIIAMMTGSWEAAKALAGDAVRMLPYNADVYYNYAVAVERNDDPAEALEYYLRAAELAEDGAEHSFEIEEIEKKANMLLDILETTPFENGLDINTLDFCKFMGKYFWEHRYSLFHEIVPIIGFNYYDYRQFPPFFIAFAASARQINPEDEIGINNSAVVSCLEMQRIIASTSSITVSVDKDSYISLSTYKGNVLHIEEESRGTADIRIFDHLQFYDLKFPKGKYSISADGLFNLGTVVPIGHSPDRKRVVISIFIDGLSQYVINDNMRELMPNTYRFFSKGVICHNTYSSADWTLPGVMSAATGLSTASHKMIHPWKLRKLELQTPMLAEYFCNKGYNTSKIGGNWRINPTYGYGRGFNRIMYKHQYEGFNPESKIAETIEQLYSMRDTDQFIWLDIGDLHQVADGKNLGLCIGQLPVMDNGMMKGSINSVKQDYDPIKIKYYEEKVRFVDRKLDALYHYIETNYSDDEILVAAFSDHGQSFLIEEGEEFLDKKRSNVALMVRGCGLQGESEEFISICDYSEILCKLTGIPYNNEYTDSNLPITFGGDKEREYTITETIHVGDPYHIVLHSKDYTFYLNGVEPVKDDCLIVLDEFSVKLQDKQGDSMDNEELKDSLTRICLERIAPNLYYPKE